MLIARTPSTLPVDASGPKLIEPTPPKPPPYSPPSVALRKVLGTQRSSQPCGRLCRSKSPMRMPACARPTPGFTHSRAL